MKTDNLNSMTGPPVSLSRQIPAHKNALILNLAQPNERYMFKEFQFTEESFKIGAPFAGILDGCLMCHTS